MALTEFGKAVRKARIELNETLVTMASAIGTSVSFLSGMETGRKKVTNEWVEKINAFLASRNQKIENLDALAAIANESVPIDGLPLQQQMLIAGFAKSRFTPDELKSIAELLKQINQNHKG